MVACVALSSSQPADSLALPMTSTSAQAVEDLKKQLLFAAENDDESLCESMLDELRKAVTNREILEVTRVGFHLNTVRRNFLKKWPQLSKKSRDIIKLWQEFVQDDKKPLSSAGSSRNVTPNLVSPSIAKLRRAPNTPINRRITSTGLSYGSRQNTLSPATSNHNNNNGSHAPRISPALPTTSELAPTPVVSLAVGSNGSANGFHKSQSVGGELHYAGDAAGDDGVVRNGKRKAEETLGTTLKRTKTEAKFLSSGAPLTPILSSVSAVRKNAQSTSELVAQLSQNLPEHMNFDLRQHEEKVKREQQDEELAHHLHHGTASTSLVVGERKKRKYERKQKPTASAPVASGGGGDVPPPEERRGGLVIRFGRDERVEFVNPRPPPDEDVEPKPKPTSSSVTSAAVAKAPTVASVDADDIAYEDEGPASARAPDRPKVDWMAMLPSLEELRLRSKGDQDDVRPTHCNEICEATKNDPTKVQRLRRERRKMLMLPYLENPLGPDFLRYRYPNSVQYYSEENFAFGAPRPTL